MPDTSVNCRAVGKPQVKQQEKQPSGHFFNQFAGKFPIKIKATIPQKGKLRFRNTAVFFNYDDDGESP